MAFQNTFLVLLTVALMSSATISVRDIPKGLHLQDDNTNTSDCWAALSELRSCSNEIIGFFLNGQTDIDTPCCLAIEVITKNCLPAMLTILGLSTEEGRLLAGYCDSSSSGPAGSPSLSSARNLD